MRAGRYARICVCLQRSTKYLFKFFDAAKLKASLKSRHSYSRSRQFGKAARFAELYGMMKPAVHIMVGSKEMHDNMEKHLLML
jgi:hypothetical protein